MSLESFLDEESSPLTPEEWRQMHAHVVDVARRHLVGRRIVDLFGPLGAGVEAIGLTQSVERQRASLDDEEQIDGAPLSRRMARSPRSIPVIHRDFTLHWREIAAAHDNGVPLDFSPAVEAALACARREDELVFYGDESRGVPGLLTAPGRVQVPLGDWRAPSEGLSAVVRAAEALQHDNPLPYALLLSPRLFSMLHRVFGDGGTLEIDAIRSFIQGGVFVSNQLELETAALIAPGPHNFDLAVSIDLSVAYLGAEEMEHPFRVLEAVLPRVKRPLAICTLEKTL